MIKKMSKCIIVLLIVTMFAALASNIVYAGTMGQALTSVDADMTTGASTKISHVMGTLMTMVRVIGVTVAVVMLLVIAMKYMMAAPGEKAEMKKSMTAYIVGAVVLFAVTGILTIISDFADVIKAS